MACSARRYKTTHQAVRTRDSRHRAAAVCSGAMCFCDRERRSAAAGEREESCFALRIFVFFSNGSMLSQFSAATSRRRKARNKSKKRRSRQSAIFAPHFRTIAWRRSLTIFSQRSFTVCASRRRCLFDTPQQWRYTIRSSSRRQIFKTR